VSKREEAFMHNHGGRLYGTNTTGQQLWVELHFLDRLKPSVAIPNLMRRTKNLQPYTTMFGRIITNESKYFVNLACT
jgi:hypothetical protein